MIKVESGKVYNIRSKEPTPTSMGPSNLVYACYIIETGRGISMLYMNRKYGRVDVSAFEFINKFEVVSEYEFNEPFEYTSTTTH